MVAPAKLLWIAPIPYGSAAAYAVQLAGTLSLVFDTIDIPAGRSTSPMCVFHFGISLVVRQCWIEG